MHLSLFVKKFGAITILTSFIVSAFAFVLPNKTNAQIAGGIFGGSSTASSSGSISGIGGALAGCALNSALSSESPESAAEDASDQAGGNYVPVLDYKVKKKVAAQEKKESCWDAVGYAAAKVLLKKITLATISWINTGFKGEPLYLKNPESFFTSIADEEIMGITTLISGDGAAARFPFGKDIARNIILSTQAHFEQNAEYSLSKVLDNQETTVKFQSDFTAGGWDGWLAMTQFPQNNQIGANIQAADEVSVRLSGTAMSRADEIRQQLLASGGFLNLDKCIEPSNWDPEGDIPCSRYETLTPGGVLANQLNISLGTSQRQLELADEINESLGAVFDALTVQLLNKGVAALGLDAQGTSSGYSITQYGGYGNNSNQNSLNGDNTQNQQDPMAWYNANQNFNIWHDLQPIIDIQWKYKNLLDASYEDPITKDRAYYPVTVTEKLENGTTREYEYIGQNAMLQYQLLPAIYELDFCVPGPNPLWRNNADPLMDGFINALPQDSGDSEKMKQYLKRQKYFDPGGFFSGIASAIAQDAADDALNDLNVLILAKILGLYTTDSSKNNLDHVDKMTGAVTLAWEGYKERIAEKYSLINMPSVAYPAYKEYRKVPQYLQMIQRNQEKIDERASIIRRLEFIRDQVKNIREPVSGNYEDSPEHEKIASYLRTIGRIAPDLATQSTIETAEDDVLVMKDTVAYVAGAQGLIADCISDLSSSEWDSIKNLRFPYPTNLLPKEIQDKYASLFGVLTTYNVGPVPTGDDISSAFDTIDNINSEATIGAGVGFATTGEPIGATIGAAAGGVIGALTSGNNNNSIGSYSPRSGDTQLPGIYYGYTTSQSGPDNMFVYVSQYVSLSASNMGMGTFESFLGVY